MPPFWLALILIIFFSANLNILPPVGPQGAISTYLDPAQISALVLPVAALALVTIALFSRYMRSSMLDNLVQDYVRTARAKGVSTSGVLYRHVLRNAFTQRRLRERVLIHAIVTGLVVLEPEMRHVVRERQEPGVVAVHASPEQTPCLLHQAAVPDGKVPGHRERRGAVGDQ